MNALAEIAKTAPVVGLSSQELDLVKKTVANGATDAELKLFLFDCQRRGVHPLDKLIHFTKRGGRYTPVTSIDFMRTRAAMTGEMAGSDDALFIGSEPPESATVTVYRLTQGQRFAYTATARWSEYCPDNAPMWKRMPHTMLAKCAEALALRKAFPQELGGLYTSDEMDQAGKEDAPLVVRPLETLTAASSVDPVGHKNGPALSGPSVPNGGDSGASVPPGFVLIAELRGPRAGAKGELITADGESFLFYKDKFTAPAMDWCQRQTPVQLTIKKSASGNRYLDDIQPLPQPITDAELDAEIAKQDMAKRAGEVI